MAFVKKDDDRTRAERVQAAMDPAFTNRQWSLLDVGNGAHQRDVMRQYEQIKLTEQLLDEQRETNRLLRQLVSERGAG